MDWDAVPGADSYHSAEMARAADLALSDAVLIARVRDGDLEAFDPLYRRHAACALRRAHYWTRTRAAAEDLCAEAFTRVLSAIRHGAGPTEAMLPYLGAAMQHIAGEWARGDRRMYLVARTSNPASPELQGDPVLAALERSLAAVAFAALPVRWQSVLWHTEVEGQRPGQLVAVLGIEASAVAALACRAREGLRAAYLQAHITEIGDTSCRPYALRLGAHVRRRLGPRERAKLCAHLHDCASCARLYAMVKYVNGHLSALARPVPVHTEGNGGGALVGVFLQTTAALVGDFDVTELLHTLATRCVRVLGADAAGLMLKDQHGRLRTAAASSQNAGLLKLFELQSDVGPCFDACRTGAPVVNADLHEYRLRWPRFAEAAQATGYVSVHALPLRLRTTVMGALNLFCAHSGGLSDADVRTGQAFANLAAIGILAQREQHQAEFLATRLQHTLNNRVIIEQAKGVLAERRNITVEAAFTLLREHARDHNLYLSDLARDVAQGSGSAAELLCGPQQRLDDLSRRETS